MLNKDEAFCGSKLKSCSDSMGLLYSVCSKHVEEGAKGDVTGGLTNLLREVLRARLSMDHVETAESGRL